MPEKDLYKQLKNVFSNYKDQTGTEFDLQRHEDYLSVGVPDCSFGILGVNGWIELKYSDSFTNEFNTQLRPEQKSWLVRRGRAGGHCHLFSAHIRIPNLRDL